MVNKQLDDLEKLQRKIMPKLVLNNVVIVLMQCANIGIKPLWLFIVFELVIIVFAVIVGVNLLVLYVPLLWKWGSRCPLVLKEIRDSLKEFI